MSSADRSQVSVARLRQLAQDALIKLGVPQKDAAVTADVLVDAELSGVESHGLMRLPVYATRLADGAIDPRPDIRSTVNGATALMDGGNGLGPVVAGRAADLCSQLAGQYGVGVVSVRRSNHFGTAAYYSRRMAERGCIGFCASLAGPTMAPFGGMDLLLGTNPFSIAFPGGKLTFCADMASSATAKGKIRIYAQKGLSIPLGWALDENGNDTTDPAAAIKGILLPMAGHKGYALAMAVDALCGLLSGAALSGESTSVFQGSQPANTGHFMAAVDIGHFLDVDAFARRAEDWFNTIRTSRTRPGFSRILIPGEPEALSRAAAEETVSVLTRTLEQAEQLASRS